MPLPAGRSTVVVALLALAAHAAGAQRAAAPILPADLMRHVSVLAHDSLEGRLVGSPGGAKARAYVIREFTAAGLTPIGESFEQRDSTPSGRGAASGTVPATLVNVVGVVRGRTNPDRYIVLSAHYDHVGVRGGAVFNGADDNASGTAALIEIARHLRANPLANSVIIAAFDAEEGGLRGARAFVRSPPVPRDRIVMNVNLDMVGRNDKNELYAAGTSHYPFLKPYLDSVAAQSSIRLLLGHDNPSGPRGDNWTSQSDHAAFHEAGIPFIYFGVEDHPDYHRATDDAERLMPEFFAGAANTVLSALRAFDAALSEIAKAAPPRNGAR